MNLSQRSVEPDFDSVSCASASPIGSITSNSSRMRTPSCLCRNDSGSPSCFTSFRASGSSGTATTWAFDRRLWCLPRRAPQTDSAFWHKRSAQMAHEHGKRYCLHSCGNVKAIMEDLICDVAIDAKHSFEDAIMPMTEVYGSRNGCGFPLPEHRREDSPEGASHIRGLPSRRRIRAAIGQLDSQLHALGQLRDHARQRPTFLARLLTRPRRCP